MESSVKWEPGSESMISRPLFSVPDDVHPGCTYGFAFEHFRHLIPTGIVDAPEIYEHITWCVLYEKIEDKKWRYLGRSECSWVQHSPSKVMRRQVALGVLTHALYGHEHPGMRWLCRKALDAVIERATLDHHARKLGGWKVVVQALKAAKQEAAVAAEPVKHS